MQQMRRHFFSGRRAVFVLDKIAKGRITFVVNRSLQADRSARNLQQVFDFVGRGFHAQSKLLNRGVAAQFLNQLKLNAAHPVELVAHMHRHTDRTALVGHSAADGLTNPPRGIGAEFVPALVFKFVGSANQADVALLD